MQAVKIYVNLKRYASIYGAGAVGALQALKLEIFSLPPNVHLYLGYLFSIIAVFSVFFGRMHCRRLHKKVNEVVQKMKDFDNSKPPETKK